MINIRVVTLCVVSLSCVCVVALSAVLLTFPPVASTAARASVALTTRGGRCKSSFPPRNLIDVKPATSSDIIQLCNQIDSTNLLFLGS